MGGKPSDSTPDRRLVDAFRSRRDRAGGFANLINFRIKLVRLTTWLGLFGTIALIGISLYRTASTGRSCFGFAELFGHFLLLGLFAKLLKKFTEFPSPHPESHPGVQVLSIGGKGADLVAFVHSVAAEVDVAPQSIRVLLLKDVGHFGPSVIETRHIPGWTSTHEQAVLVVPMGFFILFRGQRPIARALLTHEMAHLLSGDTIRWHQSCIYRGVVWLLIAASFIGVATACLSVVQDPGEASTADHNLAQRSSAAFGQRLGEVFGQFLYSVGYPLIVWSHIRFIRSCRRFSEITADCCAAAYCGSDTMRAALEYCVANSDKHAPSRGYHPPLKYRLRRLAEGYRDRLGTFGRTLALLAVTGMVVWLVARSSPEVTLDEDVIVAIAAFLKVKDLGPVPPTLTINEVVLWAVLASFILPLGWYRDWVMRE